MPNKGYKPNKEHRDNLKKAKIGGKLTQEHKDNIRKNHPHLSGEKHSMFGKKHKQSSKDLMSKNQNHKLDCQCSFCKNKRGELTGENHYNYGKHNDNHKSDCKCSFCKAMKGERSGENNPLFKGKEYQTKNGRWWIWVDGIRYKKARYVAIKCLGRELAKGEEVHHINEDKSDDRPENLYLFPSTSEHSRHHGWKNKPTLISNLI